MYPEIPLPPKPILTRWGTWLEAVEYYAEHIDSINNVLLALDSEDAVSIDTAKTVTCDISVKNDLAHIQHTFSCIIKTLKSLQNRHLSLSESFEIINSTVEQLNRGRGKVADAVRAKVDTVLSKNPGYEELQKVVAVMSGESTVKINLDLSPADIVKLNYVPVTSCDVERSFSQYKSILRDNRRRFTFQHLKEMFVTYCYGPRSFLLYGQRNTLSRLLPGSDDCPDVVLPIHSVKNVRALEYDPVSQYIYCNSVIEGHNIVGDKHAQLRISTNFNEHVLYFRSSVHQEIIDNGTHTGPAFVPASSIHFPYDMALDPYGRVLYWTCANTNAINVTRLDNGSAVGVVVKVEGEKLETLSFIRKRFNVLDRSWWAPRILRARMDGKSRIVIASEIENLSALAVDRVADLLFWAQPNQIESSDLNGKGRYRMRLFLYCDFRVSVLLIYSAGRNEVISRRLINILGYLASESNEGDNAGEMSPRSNTENYPAFTHIVLRENPGKKPLPGYLEDKVRFVYNGDLESKVRSNITDDRNVCAMDIRKINSGRILPTIKFYLQGIFGKHIRKVSFDRILPTIKFYLQGIFAKQVLAEYYRRSSSIYKAYFESIFAKQVLAEYYRRSSSIYKAYSESKFRPNITDDQVLFTRHILKAYSESKFRLNITDDQVLFTSHIRNITDDQVLFTRHIRKASSGRILPTFSFYLQGIFKKANIANDRVICTMNIRKMKPRRILPMIEFYLQ
ncbi:hypothetical protein ANN_02360 [Periplaneta americana]|uniref:Uncharacterized protein n=1 Tax=Periplaneta americana TaxID=6978 RepID=A0ABQ8TW12_PERAM|nr:hypothetical protein ANN_02360 [Periplaneta americana]